MPQEPEEEDHQHSRDNKEHIDSAARGPPGAASAHSASAADSGHCTFDKSSWGERPMAVKQRNYPFAAGKKLCRSMDALSDLVASIQTSIEASDWIDTFQALSADEK